jgi:hypothetical protein
MECAYYLVDGTWNVPTTLTFVGCVDLLALIVFGSELAGLSNATCIVR